MMITNKPLYATVVMALSLVNAAPLQDTNGAVQPIILSETIPAHKDLDNGHQGMQVTSATGPEENTFSHLTMLAPEGQEFKQKQGWEGEQDGEWEDSEESSEEMAKYVLSLREYIDTLSEEEYEVFLDCYLEEGNEEDVFALDLALDLEDPHLFSDEDEDVIEFVPFEAARNTEYSRHRHHHRNRYGSQHRNHHHRQHEEERVCSVEEMENGVCEPSREEYSHHHHRSRHHRHHRHHHEHDNPSSPHSHHHHHVEEEYSRSPYHQQHLRIDPIQLTSADGFTKAENFSRPSITPQTYNSDLLGSSTDLDKRNTINVHMEKANAALMTSHVNALKSPTTLMDKREPKTVDDNHISLNYDLRRSLDDVSGKSGVTV